MKYFYLLFFFKLTINVECQSTFELRVNQNYSQEAQNIIEGPDGSFYIVGASNNGVHEWNNFNGYLIKVSSQGVLQKDTVFYKTSNLLVYSKVIFNSNNNLIILGFENDSIGQRRLNFSEYDINFNRIWSKYYYNNIYTKYQNVESIYRSHDTLTAICHGQTASYDDDYFICQFKENGDTIRTVNFQYPGLQLGFEILKTNTGYKLITFNTPDGSSLLGNNIVTLDNNFNEIGVKELSSFPPINPFGNNPFYSNTAAKWLNDSIYIASARVVNMEYVTQTDEKNQGIGVIFVKKNDDLLDSRVFGKADTSEKEALKGMDFLYKQHIYITGTSNYFQGPIPSFTSQKSWIMISKMDSVGNVKWTKYFGGDKSYYAYQILATKDSGCVVIANYYDDQKGTGDELDVYILKLGPDGNLSVAIDEKDLPKTSFTIYPNPSNNILNIKSNFDVPAKIELYNALGSKVLEYTMFTNYVSIDMSRFSNGIYNYKIITNKGKTATGKWIKI